MKTPAYHCDGPNCSVTKGENNHWFLILRDGDSFRVVPWKDSLAAQENIQHICGQHCAQKVFEAYLTSPQVEVRFDLHPAEVVEESAPEKKAMRRKQA